eukprot:624463-Prymnesium_polylepis.1
MPHSAVGHCPRQGAKAIGAKIRRWEGPPVGGVSHHKVRTLYGFTWNLHIESSTKAPNHH